jgi:hypothetical protein
MIGKNARIKHVFVGRGCRGHKHQGPESVSVDQLLRGVIPKWLWRLMKRRAAIEPTIGHMKSEHRLERNRLKGTCGDAINGNRPRNPIYRGGGIGARVHSWKPGYSPIPTANASGDYA